MSFDDGSGSPWPRIFSTPIPWPVLTIQTYSGADSEPVAPIWKVYPATPVEASSNELTS